MLPVYGNISFLFSLFFLACPTRQKNPVIDDAMYHNQFCMLELRKCHGHTLMIDKNNLASQMDFVGFPKHHKEENIFLSQLPCDGAALLLARGESCARYECTIQVWRGWSGEY